MFEIVKDIDIVYAKDATYAVYDESYYKIGQASLNLLQSLKDSRDINDIKNEMSINDDDINKFLSSFKKEKKDRKIMQMFTLFPPTVCDFFAKKFYWLHRKHAYYVTILLFLTTLSLHYAESSISFIYAGITYIHYLLALSIIMIWHEFGHLSAAFERGIKGLKIKAGVFFIFPTLHVNMNAVNILSKDERLKIDFGGLYFQMILSSALALINMATHSAFAEMMFTINIFLLFWNAVPFFITDGYWLYSDYFNISNLNTRADEYIGSLLHGKRQTGIKPIALYTLWRCILQGTMFYYIFFIFYRRLGFVEEVYYQLIETNFSLWSITQALILMLPFIFLTLFIIKKIRKWSLQK